MWENCMAVCHVFVTLLVTGWLLSADPDTGVWPVSSQMLLQAPPTSGASVCMHNQWH